MTKTINVTIFEGTTVARGDYDKCMEKFMELFNNIPEEKLAVLAITQEQNEIKIKREQRNILMGGLS